MFNDILTESLIMSRQNLELNLNAWKSGKNNVLYVTGHSGSGKTTYAVDEAGKNEAIVISLDKYEHYTTIQPNNPSAGDLVLLGYVKTGNNEANLNAALMDVKRFNYTKFIDEFTKFFDWLVKTTEADKSKRYIIEGIQLFFVGSSEFFSDRSLVVVNASLLKSIYQKVFIRKDKISLKDLPTIFKYYKSNELILIKLRKSICRNMKDKTNFVNSKPTTFLHEGAGSMFNEIINQLVTEGTDEPIGNASIFGSILEAATDAQDPNDFDKDGKIKTLEDAFSDDPIGLKVAYMVATSHEYKKPNVEAALSFAKNYKWKVATMRVDNIEGINKPIIKEKVLEIANSLKEEGANKKWPLVVVDKLHGICPQTPGKKICVDGHHRYHGCELAGLKFTDVYSGTYTGDAEKSTEELINESDATILIEGIFITTAKGRIKVSDNIKTVESAITSGLTMIEKFIPLITKYLSDIDKPYDKAMIRIVKKFHDDAIAIDYERGTVPELRKQSAAYVKLRMNKIFNRADYKSENVSSEMAAFLQKCSKNGEYANKVIKLTKDMEIIFKRIIDRANKLRKEKVQDGSGDLLRVAYDEYKFFAQQLQMYNADIIQFMKSHKTSITESALLEAVNRAEYDYLTDEELAAVREKYPDAECTFLKSVATGKYFCMTHRCRSKEYDSPTDIPVSEVNFVSSTS